MARRPRMAMDWDRDARSRFDERSSYSSQSAPRRSQISKREQAPAKESENLPAILAWPSQLFEMMLMPWRGLMPMEGWLESRRGGQAEFPKTESEETEAEYLYRVELPGIAPEQLELSFQNGTIMLRVFHYRGSRSIRRAFTLPVYTDGEAVMAELRNGELTIVIPKTDRPVAPRSRIIDIDVI